MKTATFYAAGIVLLLLFTNCKQENFKNGSIVQDVQLEKVAGVEKIKMEEAGFDDKNQYDDQQNNSLDSTSNTSKPNIQKNNSQKPSIDWDKKIIKTANVTLELKDYQQYNQQIHNSIKRYGAYISSEEQSQSDETIENKISIKVPVELFEDLMNTLSGEGISVLEKRINTEDVTAEYTDTKGRVEAKKEVRNQYLALLKQAKNMKDILEVQNEINGITEELESATGRVKFLSNQSSYSTIHLKYFQHLQPGKIAKAEKGFLYKVKEAFLDGTKGIGSLIIGLTTIWPLFILVLIIIFGYKKWMKK